MRRSSLLENEWVMAAALFLLVFSFVSGALREDMEYCEGAPQECAPAWLIPATEQKGGM